MFPAPVASGHDEGHGRVGVGLPAPARVEPSGELVEVELGGAGRRQHDDVVAGPRDQPPADLLPAARRPSSAGVLRPATGRIVVRVEGAGVVLRPGRAATSSPLGPAGPTSCPSPGFEVIAGAVAVMPAQVDRCTVDGEVVEPQPGGFYGGWITARVVGPFKGGPGTTGW